jgi:hypothetical protein
MTHKTELEAFIDSLQPREVSDMLSVQITRMKKEAYSSLTVIIPLAISNLRVMGEQAMAEELTVFLGKLKTPV